MEDIRKVDRKMIKQLNKKIEQQDKDDFKPLLYIVITLVATMITCTLLMSFKASAINFDYGGFAGLSGSSKMYGLQGQLGFQEIGAGKIKSNMANASQYGQTSSLNLCLYDTIPAGSIFSVSSKWAGIEVGTSNLKYPQVQLTANSYDYSVITNTYGEYGAVTTLLYTDVAVSGCSLWFVVSPVTLNQLDIEILPINWVKLSNSEGLTQQDKNTLFQNLTNIAGATTNASLNSLEILNLLKEQQTNAEEQTQEASEEGQQNAEGTQTDNEQASQSVLSIIGNVIGAFSTGATDCKINADLGNLDLGDLDFCQHKPSEITNMINAFGSILVVYACYKVAKHIFGLWVKITTYAQGGNLTGGNE